MYLLGILCLVAATAAQFILPEPPTLPNSVVAAHQNSRSNIHTYNQNPVTASAPLHDGLTNEKDNEEVKKDMPKMESLVFLLPRQIQTSDYPIIKKQKESEKHIYEETVKQKNENSKKEKATVIPGKPLKVGLLPNTATLTDSIIGLQDCEACANILIVSSDSARLEDKKDDETVKNNIIIIPSIFIPTLPKPRLFDYSIFKKQIDGQNHESYDAMKQRAKKSKKEKKGIILAQKKSAQVKMPSNPDIFLDYVTAPQNSEVRTKILSVRTDFDSVADKNDDEEVRHMVKINTVVEPPPPELPPFYYSILKKQKSDLNLKADYSAKQAAEKYKNEKETVILDSEKPVQVKVPPNAATVPNSAAALPVSEVISDDSDNEEAKMNMIKIASIVIPPPPELPLFDYSVLEKQISDQKQELNDVVHQKVTKSKEDKELVIQDLEKSVQVQVSQNPSTVIDSVIAPQDSELRATILSVNTDSAPEADKRYDEKENMFKISTVVMPPPPELAPFDFPVMRKQKSNPNLKSEFSSKQAAEKYKEKKGTVILDLEKPVKVEVLPNPAAVPNSVAALPVSEVRMNILNVVTDAAPEVDKNYNEEVKMHMVKIASTIIPTPPEIPPFDYSILRKQKAHPNLKTGYSAKQAAEKYKEEKDTLILDLEKPVKAEVLPNPATVKNSVAALPVSEVISDDSDNEEAKLNMIKIASIVIPPPPELPLFDYSILEKQISDQKKKLNDVLNQKITKSKEDKELVIQDLEKYVQTKVQPNTPTVIDSVIAPQDSELHAAILHVNTDSTPGADKRYDEKENMVKISTVVMPPPPELATFDYSILRKQKSNLNLKPEYSAKQSTDKSTEQKVTAILDLENPIKVERPPHPPTLPDSVAALPVSEVRMNILNAATDAAAEVDKNYNEEVKMHMAKIASTIIPTPPELPPFDYSILRKQKADPNLKDEYSAKQAAEEYYEGKDMGILDLETPIKVEEPAYPATVPNSVAALPISEVISDDSDNEEAKMNMIKITSIVIPPPPELPLFDYSILEKQISDQKQKLNDVLHQKITKSKEDKKFVIQDLEKSVQTKVPPNTPTVIDSVIAPQDSELRATILHVNTDSTPGAVKMYDEKENMVKISTVAMPPPPELAPFDYSILRKQKSNLNLKPEYSAKQSTDKSTEQKVTAILDLENPIKVERLPHPPTLPDSVAALPVSEVHMNILNAATDAAAEVDKNYNEDVKIASTIIPTPPNLPAFGYSILRKQKANPILKSEYSVKQTAEKYKNEKGTVILDFEKPAKVEVPAYPATVKNSVAALPVSEVISDDSDNEEAKMNIIKIDSIVIPPPPELPLFDYSVLEKQRSDQKQKLNDVLNQKVTESNEDKEVVIQGLEKSVQAKVPLIPPTLIDSVIAPQDSEFRTSILSVTTDSAPVAGKKYDEEVKHNTIKISEVVMPPPPELTPFDYTILRKHKTNLNQKSEYSAKQSTAKSTEEKVTAILDLENPIKVERPPYPPTLPDSVAALPVSEVRTNILNVATDAAPEVNKNYSEEVKMHMVKIASTVIPTPPELPPFDYSILRKQKADFNLKSEYFSKKAAEKYKEKKDTVISDLEKPVTVEVPPNPATVPDSVAALPVSEVISDSDNKEAKMNMIKITSIVIPPTPEVPLIHYSILKKQIADQNQKSIYVLKQNEENSKKENGGFIIEKPVEVKVEEPKLIEFVEDSKPTEDPKPAEESKPKEDLIKKPVKHSDDIPVIIKWTIPTAPFLSKIISNCPPMPSFGLNWLFQRPMSRC